MLTLEYFFEEEEGEVIGIEALSLVRDPAGRKEFVAMSEAQKVMLSAIDEDKRLLIGPVLQPGIPPGQPLRGKKGYFSAETIGKLMEDFQKKGRQKNTTVYHSDAVDDCVAFQHWQVDRKNGVMAGYGFDEGKNKVEDGTWMAAMKVNNDDVWHKDVKAGNVRGFSPEGNLKTRQVMMSDKDALKEETLNMFKSLVKKYK